MLNCVLTEIKISHFLKRLSSRVSLFPYLFKLCVEILGHTIRQNKHVNDIPVRIEKMCLLQCVSDTAFMLDVSEKRLKSRPNCFQYSKSQCLNPNISETKPIWMSSKINFKIIDLLK